MKDLKLSNPDTPVLLKNYYLFNFNPNLLVTVNSSPTTFFIHLHTLTTDSARFLLSLLFFYFNFFFLGNEALSEFIAGFSKWPLLITHVKEEYTLAKFLAFLKKRFIDKWNQRASFYYVNLHVCKIWQVVRTASKSGPLHVTQCAENGELYIQ